MPVFGMAPVARFCSMNVSDAMDLFPIISLVDIFKVLHAMLFRTHSDRHRAVKPRNLFLCEAIEGRAFSAQGELFRS